MRLLEDVQPLTPTQHLIVHLVNKTVELSSTCTLRTLYRDFVDEMWSMLSFVIVTFSISSTHDIDLQNCSAHDIMCTHRINYWIGSYVRAFNDVSPPNLKQ